VAKTLPNPSGPKGSSGGSSLWVPGFPNKGVGLLRPYFLLDPKTASKFISICFYLICQITNLCLTKNRDWTSI